MATMSKRNMRASASLMLILIFCLVSSCIAQDYCKGEVPGKIRWPELLGVDGRVAAKIIEKENPLVHVILLLEGTGTTKDINCRRVRVFVSKTNGTVVEVPYVG